MVLSKMEGLEFFEFSNSRDKNIKFTQEPLIDGNIDFLDCMVSIDEDGSLATGVYRKPTHTDHYLNFDSNHPLIHKLGVIHTLNHRAASIITDPEKLVEEQDHVKKALRGCGYPKWAFHKAAKKGKKPPTESGNGRSEKALAMIPYVAGVAEKIKNALKSYNISTMFKPIGTLRSKLVKVKDKMPKEKMSNLVHGVP